MKKPSLEGVSVAEAIELFTNRLDELADELHLAAKHPANPGSTNGTLIQVANSLTTIARSMRDGAKPAP